MRGTRVIPEKGAKPAVATDVSTAAAPAWYAIWTRSNCEQLVNDQLNDRGFSLFLPKATVWSDRGRIKKRVTVPLFPGYLFVHHVLDRHAHVEIIKARGVVRVLGDTLDGITPIPDHEVARLQRLVDAELPMFPYIGFNGGDPVRITAGPLAGLEGTFVRGRPDKGLFVVTVTLLQRHVAVEVDCATVRRT
jgi:transcription antitermination factor NusG